MVSKLGVARGSEARSRKQSGRGLKTVVFMEVDTYVSEGHKFPTLTNDWEDAHTEKEASLETINKKQN